MYPKEYIQFLAHFHGDRDYFECHEVLEEYWKKTDERNKSSIWVGLILLAVSTYHHRRQNFTGAERTLEKAFTIFEQQPHNVSKLGLNPLLLNDLVQRQLTMIAKKTGYHSFDLPIEDPLLLEQGKRYCQQAGFQWGEASDLSNNALIHRHLLRDRTTIVQERQDALNMKKGNE